jgi:hypothetical protein
MEASERDLHLYRTIWVDVVQYQRRKAHLLSGDSNLSTWRFAVDKEYG